jgi:glycosyltransferase involved in cell wall biosynthesis
LRATLDLLSANGETSPFFEFAMAFNWERTPIARSPISAIVPVYRHSSTITALVEELVRELQSLERPFEILLVDDASTDDTPAKLEDLAKRFSQVRVLKQEQHQGQGMALRRGLAEAKHPLLLTIPADGSYPPVVLHRLLGDIDEVDMVIGVRHGLSAWDRFRESWQSKLFMGVGVKDPACPLRLYRQEMFQNLPLQSHGPFVHQEILAKGTFLERIMTEVEVNWEPKPASAEEPSVGRDFFRVFRKPTFGPAKP